MFIYAFLYWCCVAWVAALFLSEGECSYRVDRLESWGRILVSPVLFIIIMIITVGSLIKGGFKHTRR